MTHYALRCPLSEKAAADLDLLPKLAERQATESCRRDGLNFDGLRHWQVVYPNPAYVESGGDGGGEPVLVVDFDASIPPPPPPPPPGESA